MTMVEEEVLRSALRNAADGFAVSDDAAEQILSAARDLDGRPRVVGRRRRRLEHEKPAPGLPGRGPGEGEGRGEGAGESAESPGRRGRRPVRALVAATVALAVVGLSVSAVVTWGDSRATNSAMTSLGTSSPERTAGLGLARGGVGARAGAHQDAAAPPGAAAQPSASSHPTGPVGQVSKVEETGSVDLTVGRGKLETVLTRLTDLAIANGGFAATTQTQAGATTDTPSYGTITLQVPQASFGSVLGQAQTLGTVTSLTTKGTDVTGQYVDLQSRIGALQASRDQYLTIMSKATSISDILAVQNQLDSLQSRLEQLQGQLQVLDSQTTYGTLAISLTESGAHRTPPPPPGSGIGSAWHGAVSGFAAAFDGLVRIAGPALFAVLCLAALLLFGRVTWRGVRRRTL